jgi:hypothetical protein
MTQPQFEADFGERVVGLAAETVAHVKQAMGRAENEGNLAVVAMSLDAGLREEPRLFRKLLEGTMRSMASEQIATFEGNSDLEQAYAGYSDQELAVCLISTLLDVVRDQQEWRKGAEGLAEALEAAMNALGVRPRKIFAQ